MIRMDRSTDTGTGGSHQVSSGLRGRRLTLACAIWVVVALLSMGRFVPRWTIVPALVRISNDAISVPYPKLARISLG